jgi:protein TonB
VRPETTPRIVEIPSEVADSLVISKIAPQYPSAAKVARISGRVLIQATISATGTIESLHVLSGPDVLRKAAIDAVSKWRFRPYKLNDRPAAAEIRVGVSFNLGG